MTTSKNRPGLLCLALAATAASPPTLASEEIIYYHNDALGSPVAATDRDGVLLWREQYAPYGSRLLLQSRETDCSTGPCLPEESIWDEKQWYTGKLEETRAGLQYFGARWYEPEIGRFMSVDPVSFREDNVFSFNRYTYGNNNPYKYLDPDGKDSITITGSIHVPGSILYFLGVSKVPVSGFTGGIAFSFPGFWGKSNAYAIGLVGGVDIPVLDAGLGKASIDIGYSKSSFSELSGDGIEMSATIGVFNGGLNWDTDSNEVTGVKLGGGVALGKLSKGLKSMAGKIKNRDLKHLAEGFIQNNVSVMYQKNSAVSLAESGSSKSPDTQQRKDNE